MKRTPLKRNTGLKANTDLKRTTGLKPSRKRINPMTLKRKIESPIWQDVINQVAAERYHKCPVCGLIGTRDKEWIDTYYFYLWGHHRDHNRRNNTLENCLPVRWNCHSYIEQHP